MGGVPQALQARHGRASGIEQALLPGRRPGIGVDAGERRALHGLAGPLPRRPEFLDQLDHPLIVGRRVGVAPRPGQRQPGYPLILGAQHQPHRAERRPAVRRAIVQRPHIGVQLGTQCRSLLAGKLPPGLLERLQAVARPIELLQHRQLAGLGREQVKAEIAQLGLFQPSLHHLQRRPLLGHEQHRAALRQRVGDDVGDGLALAGAGRPDHHEAGAGGGAGDGAGLRRVSLQRADQAGGFQLAIQPRRVAFTAKADRAGQLVAGRARRIDQPPHHRVAPQRLDPVGQILPHQELGERQVGQRDILGHFPSRNVAQLAADRVEDRRNVEAGSVSGRIRQAREIHGEILPQHFEQGGVEAGLVVMRAQREAGAYAVPLQEHGDQDQRRAVRLLAILLFPQQRAQCQEQRIGPALLLVVAGGAVDGRQRRLQAVLIEAADQFAPRQGLPAKFPGGILQRAAAVDLRAARIATGHQFRRGAETQRRLALLAAQLGQHCLEPRDVGAGDRQDLLAGHRQVQQAIAAGQIQQPLSPAPNAIQAPRLDRGGSILHLGAQRGRRFKHRGRGRGRSGRIRAGQRRVRPDQRRQRPDAASAGLEHVDDRIEGVVPARVELRHRRVPRGGQRRVSGPGGERALKQQHVVQCRGIAQARGIFRHRPAVRALGVPDPGKGVPFGQHDKRMQANMFKAGGQQQRRIQAVGQRLLDDLTRPADALPRLLERRRRGDVADVQRAHRAPDRMHLVPDPRLVAGLVALHRLPPALREQQVRSRADDARHHRVVRLDKGGEQVRQPHHAAPEIGGQQPDVLGPRRQHRRAVAHRKPRLARHRLGQRGDERRIELHVEVAHQPDLAGGDVLDDPGARGEDRRFAVEVEGHLREIAIRGVLDRQFAQGGHRVVQHGGVEHRLEPHGDQQRRRRRLLGGLQHVGNAQDRTIRADLVHTQRPRHVQIVGETIPDSARVRKAGLAGLAAPAPRRKTPTGSGCFGHIMLNRKQATALATTVAGMRPWAEDAGPP